MTLFESIPKSSRRVGMLVLAVQLVMAGATAHTSTAETASTAIQDANDTPTEAREPGVNTGREAAAPADSRNGIKASPIADSAAPLYVLPKVGKPRDRVGGGRRFPGAPLAEIYALVPSHVANTRSEQPVLYWYLSSGVPTDVTFELTLIDERSIDPLVEAQLITPARPGLQRVPLADHDVRLALGEEYEWSVSIVPDASHRSRDIIDRGWVERVPSPDAVERALSQGGARIGPAEQVRIYAGSGLWYDALDAAYREFQQNPQAPGARAHFDRLLLDASLPRPAELSVVP